MAHAQITPVDEASVDAVRIDDVGVDDVGVDDVGVDEDWLVRFAEFRSTGTRDARNRLVEEFSPLAEQCARRFADRGEPLDDLVQVALVGLVKAVERFDPTRGVSFPGFALPTITGEIKRHFRDHTWAVRVPRAPKELMARMRVTNDHLQQRLGRDPSVAELAEELNVSIDAVVETIEASAVYRSLSTDRPLSNGARVERSAEGHQDPETLRLSTIDALNRLDKRSRQILYWRFYEGLSQEEIGKRLGMGQVQVSRALRSLLVGLRDALADE
jgi:RNA polymerase sigma-B factor